MKIGAYGLPPCKFFPTIFYPTGPHKFQANLFYGNVNKTGNIYHIKGYCYNLQWGK